MARYVCMSCGDDLGPANTPEDSHGICRECERKYLRDIPFWDRVTATAKVDGWSAVATWAVLGVFVLWWSLMLVFGFGTG